MLDQLIESNGHRKENARRGGFLLSAFVVVCSVFFSGILWSLFAKDLAFGANNLEISTLVAPLAMKDDQPPPPAEKKIQKQPPSAPATDVRTKIVQAINESPKETPDKVSIEKSNVPPRNPNVLTKLGPDNFTAENAPAYNYKSETSDYNKNNIGGITGGNTNGDSQNAAVVPPASLPKPPPLRKETPKPPNDRKISLGVVNGKALNLVKPPYSSAAKMIRAGGTVNVQITIDEKGNVIAANAANGHPLLRQAAENAARASKFHPTLLSNQPVKATGVIVYKFSAQ